MLAQDWRYMSGFPKRSAVGFDRWGLRRLKPRNPSFAVAMPLTPPVEGVFGTAAMKRKAAAEAKAT
jgi:hypothetical protein